MSKVQMRYPLVYRKVGNFIIVTLLQCYLPSFAQISILNESLMKADTNVLYFNGYNRITIEGTNAQTRVTSKNGASISIYDSNRFVITPKNLVQDTLQVYAGNKLLATKIFTIDTLRDPTLQLGNIQGDTCTIQAMISNKGLRCFIKNSLYQSAFMVKQFSTTFITPNLDTLAKEVAAYSNLLTIEQETIIKSLKRNSKVIFHDVIVVGSSGRVRRFYGFTLVVR